MKENWGPATFTGLKERLEKIVDLVGQLQEVEAQETLKKLERLKALAEKVKSLKEKNAVD